MISNRKVTVVLPAYNAARTLRQTVAEIPRDIVDDVILTDDASRDDTVAVARELGLHTLRHDRNRGYGGNQKTCYQAALDRGADIVVMLHPDYQYTPRLVTAMASMIASDQFDVVLGSRILGRGALAGGMPVYKYIANRALTLTQNLLIGAKKRIAGLRLEASDADWSTGDGPVVRGPALSLLLAMTGRRVALDDLSGDGLAALRDRG